MTNIENGDILIADISYITIFISKIKRMEMLKMAVKLKKKPVANELPFSGRKLSEVLAEYSEISEQMKFLDKRKKELADSLKELALKTGVKDDKGSYFVDEGNKTFGRVRKCSISLNEERAMKFFKKKGLLKEVTKNVIDLDKVDILVSCGQVTSEEIESISDIKEQFQFYLGDKKTEEPEEMPEIQVSERPKKSRLNKR